MQATSPWLSASRKERPVNWAKPDQETKMQESKSLRMGSGDVEGLSSQEGGIPSAGVQGITSIASGTGWGIAWELGRTEEVGAVGAPAGGSCDWGAGAFRDKNTLSPEEEGGCGAARVLAGLNPFCNLPALTARRVRLRRKRALNSFSCPPAMWSPTEAGTWRDSQCYLRPMGTTTVGDNQPLEGNRNPGMLSYSPQNLPSFKDLLMSFGPHAMWTIFMIINSFAKKSP